MKVTPGALERHGPQMTTLSLFFMTGFRVFVTACNINQNLESFQVAQEVQLLQIFAVTGRFVVSREHEEMPGDKSWTGL